MSDEKEKDEKERVERRKGPSDRRVSTDRRGNDRVVEEADPRRKGPDRRRNPS